MPIKPAAREDCWYIFRWAFSSRARESSSRVAVSTISNCYLFSISLPKASRSGLPSNTPENSWDYCLMRQLPYLFSRVCGKISRDISAILWSSWVPLFMSRDLKATWNSTLDNWKKSALDLALKKQKLNDSKKKRERFCVWTKTRLHVFRESCSFQFLPVCLHTLDCSHLTDKWIL